jgi:Tol biopolymer transport system component
VKVCERTQPHYSPKGDWIVWMSSKGLPFRTRPFEVEAEYWLMRADGSAKQQITWFKGGS